MAQASSCDTVVLRAVPKTVGLLAEARVGLNSDGAAGCPYRRLSARNASYALDARAAPAVCAGAQRDGARERACPLGHDDRHHRSTSPDGPAEVVVDADHAPGAVVAMPGRCGVDAAAGYLPAATDDWQPPGSLEAAGRA